MPLSEVMSWAPSRSIRYSFLTLAAEALSGQQGRARHALAVALVHQELMVVDGQYLAYTRAVGEQVSVLVGFTGAGIDGDDA